MKIQEMPSNVYVDADNVLTLAGIDFTDKEINWMWENGVKYIVKGDKLYEIRYSQNYEPHFFALKIFTFDEPQTHRGRYWAMTAEEVNTSHAKDGVPTLLTN